jgi:hypothetical protein
MTSHWSFGHLQPKLWAKEGPGVKLAVWLSTTKSRESTSSQHCLEKCNMALESTWQELQLWLRTRPDSSSGRGVMALQSFESPVVTISGLWTAITPHSKLGSQRVLNQSCSSCQELFNALLHSSRRRWEEVDSQLLVVGSQIASLTPGPSFAHNLGCRCPNGQCKAIFDIYASRPFQWHQEHSNARWFRPCCRALNIRESRRTPNPQLCKCWASPPHLAKVGLRHIPT